MTAKLRKLVKDRTIRYLITGVGVYAFELGVIVCMQSFGASNTVAIAISFWLGLIVSFTLQKLFTFQDKRLHRKILLPQIIAVTLLVLFNFIFTIFVTRILGGEMPAVVVRTIAIAITTIWNFYIYRTRIFKSIDSPLID